MALATRVYDTSQIPTYDVYINGVHQVGNIISMRSGAMSFDSPVPTVDIEFTSLPAFIKRGMPVTIDFGYSGEQTRLFTGGVLALPGEYPEFFRSQCFYTGATDATGAQIAATASLIGGPPVWPPIPAGQYIDFAQDNHLVHDAPTAASEAARLLTLQARIPRRPSGKLLSQTIHCVGDLYGAFRSYQIPLQDFSGLTIKASIEAVLTACGIAAYNTAGVPNYVLAASGAILERMPGAQKLAKLMILGCHVQQLKSGMVLVQVTNFQPAPTANYTYSNTTQAYARIMDTTGEMRVPLNPLLEIGMTGQIDVDYLAVDGRYFLFGHRWEIGPSGCWSYLDQRGGDEFGGTVGINPIASFTYSIEQEPISDRVYSIVSFDASSSFDPDGTIASYAWSDDQVSTPEIETITTSHPTVRFDSAISTVNVTLTVTDNDGLTGTVTVAISLAATSSAVRIPAVGVAAGTNSAISPDGGQTWNTTASATCVSIAMRPADGVTFGHVIKGFSDGHIDRSTDSGKTWTTVLAAVGSAFNCLAWDWRNGNVTWGLTADMRLYISVDAGVTWVVYDALRTTLALAGAIGGRRAIGLPGAGGVYVSGGDGAGHPLIAFDPVVGSHGWVQETFTGDLATDTATPADATMRIVDYTAPGNGTEVMILEWASGGGGSLVAIYSTTDPPGATKSFTRATGLTAGLKVGRCVVGDAPIAGVVFHAMFSDRDVWNSTDGIAWTKTANVLPAGFAFNDCIFLSDVLTGLPGFQGVYMTASEDAGGTGLVSKSTDGLATLNPIYPATGFPAWVAGAKAKMLSIGAPGASTPSSAAVYYELATNKLYTYSFGGWNAGVSTPSSHSVNLQIAPDGTMYHLDNIKLEMYVSTNKGSSWTKVWTGTQPKGGGDLEWYGVCNYAIDASGNLYALVSRAFVADSQSVAGSQTYWPPTVWKSTDRGSSWSLLYTAPGVTMAGNANCGVIGTDIIVTQDGKGIFAATLALFWGSGTYNYPIGYYSGDSGATFTGRPFVSPMTGTAYTPFWQFTPSGRIVYYRTYASPVVFTSDDQGQTWTTRLTVAEQAIMGIAVPQVAAMFMQTFNFSAPYATYIYKSINGGTDWTQIANGPINNANAGGGGMAWKSSSDVIVLSGGDGAIVVVTGATGSSPVWSARIPVSGGTPTVTQFSGGEQVVIA